MPALVSQEDVVKLVAEEIKWVIDQHMKKLRKELHSSMSVSPFLMPLLFDLHNCNSFEELGDLLLKGHLMLGYHTSFGKLVDEKILPRVFGAEKLSRRYRAANPPLQEACFDEIDHLVRRPGGKPILLSLKASRWTINLSAARALNMAFAEILSTHSHIYDEIVVGIFNGTLVGLSDKYDILRGINRGQNHNVADLQDHVQVFAGKDFWAWINGDEPLTQEWVLEGILKGLSDAAGKDEYKRLLQGYTDAFNHLYVEHINTDGSVNWQQVLHNINGCFFKRAAPGQLLIGLSHKS